MTHYSHTQNAGLVVGGPFLLGMIGIFAAQLVFPHWANFFILGLLLALLAQFYCLTVVVDDRYIRVRFGIGMIRFRFKLTQIESCEPVRNSIWYGWGIRWYPGGWLFNIGGLNAVEINMRNGKTYRIGTNQPERLNKTINERLGG